MVNKDKIKAAIEALRRTDPAAILDAVSQLDDGEREVVSLVMELTAPPAKKKRADAGVPRAKKATNG